MADYKAKPHPDHRGWYCVPGYKSCVANRKGEIMILKTGHVSKGGDAGRYLKMSVYPDGADKPSLVHVHDLICRAFKGPPRGNVVVLHGNNNTKDNVPTNLDWGTQSDNIQQVYDDGLRPSKECPSLTW